MRDHDFHRLRIARVIDETADARSYVLDVPEDDAEAREDYLRRIRSYPDERFPAAEMANASSPSGRTTAASSACRSSTPMAIESSSTGIELGSRSPVDSH